MPSQLLVSSKIYVVLICHLDFKSSVLVYHDYSETKSEGV